MPILSSTPELCSAQVFLEIKAHKFYLTPIFHLYWLIANSDISQTGEKVESWKMYLHWSRVHWIAMRRSTDTGYRFVSWLISHVSRKEVPRIPVRPVSLGKNSCILSQRWAWVRSSSKAWENLTSPELPTFDLSIPCQYSLRTAQESRHPLTFE